MERKLKRVNLVGPQTIDTLSGLITDRVSSCLLERCVEVYRYPSLTPSTPLSSPPRTPCIFVDHLGESFPINHVRAGSFYVTWFNCTKIHPATVDYINHNSIRMIVPSEFCLTVLSGSGVKTPLFQIPFGVDTAPPLSRSTSFDTPIYILANIYNNTESLEVIVKSLEAHKLLSSGDVQLLVKSSANNIIKLSYPGVSILPTRIPDSLLVELYNLCDFYVCLDRLGWDAEMLHAMSYGVIPIAMRFAGNLEYLDEDSGILVPFFLENSHDLRACPIPDALSSIFGKLRDIQMSRTNVFNQAQAYSWSDFGRRLTDVIR